MIKLAQELRSGRGSSFCMMRLSFKALQGGEITVPGLGSMFYLSQRPYLVSGTLRDQLLYPQPPGTSSARQARRGMQISSTSKACSSLMKAWMHNLSKRWKLWSWSIFLPGGSQTLIPQSHHGLSGRYANVPSYFCRRQVSSNSAADFVRNVEVISLIDGVVGPSHAGGRDGTRCRTGMTHCRGARGNASWWPACCSTLLPSPS